jgi:hypothetical protein
MVGAEGSGRSARDKQGTARAARQKAQSGAHLKDDGVALDAGDGLHELAARLLERDDG